MTFTLVVLLLVLAFAVTIAAAMGRAPLWIAVLLVVIAELLRSGGV
jgi:hypothetical protein